MPRVSDSYFERNLKKYNINIKTKYFVGNNIYERNTDNSRNDDIKDGIRCRKEYYILNKLVHVENTFDTRIEYTFISHEDDELDYKCPNCGMNGKVKDFINGCPYCRSYYNIEYKDKELGSKNHYDRVIRSTKYRLITLIIDIICSLILSFIFIKTTSRTFNNFDIYKIFIYGGILSLILYFFFYYIDAKAVLGFIKKYKDKENKKQIDFWNRTQIDKKTFFNNLNYEVRKKYYKEDNIVDYDIIDYDSFEELKTNDSFKVKVNAYVRIVYYNNGKLYSKYKEEEYILKRNTNNIIELKNGINYIKCSNCGASIDASHEHCDYCRTEIDYIQEWKMDK